VRVAIVVTLLLLLALVDIATNADLSFLAFYFLPVLLACWYLGRREGIAVAFASVLAWTLDDLAAHRHYSHVAIPIWNRTVELTFFLFLSWLVGALKTAHENEIRARTERLEHDLAIARDVQTALLPPRRQDNEHYAVAAEYRQAFGVGGDAYDLVNLEGHALAVSIADVSGKGLPAALLMASFGASLRGLLSVRGDHLDLLAADLSERLRASVGTSRFVTAFLGIAEDGVLRYVNAGHEAALLISPQETSQLSSTGPVLGLLPGARFKEERVPFPPGSLLVLFTDGVTECVNPRGEELGRARVAQIVARAARTGKAEPADVVAELLRAVEAHAAGEAFQDDVTILCVRRR
jgi:phosphoserine phosphatase RsbU/P